MVGSDGVGLHVLVDRPEAGPAPGAPVLLVHGLASNARLWDGVRSALAADGRHVAAVDLRGHGRSDKPANGYDFETIAADLVAVLDHLGYDEAVVAGQSWGGNVVLELAARCPGRVKAALAVDGGWISLQSLGPWEQVRERMAPPDTTGTPAAQIEAYLRRAHPTWTEQSIAGAFACFEVREDGTVAPWLSRANHLSILRHLYDARPDLLFPQIRIPVVLIPCDDGSPRVDSTRAAVGRAEELLADSRTVWFRAHHDVHAERPDDIAELIRGEADR